MAQEKIILYSTNCPKCRILESKLNNTNITYEINTDADYMILRGFLSAPMLEVNGEVMDFTTANTWINERNNK